MLFRSRKDAPSSVEADQQRPIIHIARHELLVEHDPTNVRDGLYERDVGRARLFGGEGRGGEDERVDVVRQGDEVGTASRLSGGQ